METETKIQIIILERPDTVLNQYYKALLSDAKWFLITDSDAKLQFVPSYDYDNPDYEFISFIWLNAPKIFNREHFGIGLYRKDGLIRLFQKYPFLTSEGLDLVVMKELKTQYSNHFSYYHDSKLTLRRMFRYGKGRSFYMKITKQKDLPNTHFSFSYVPFYLAYILGFVYGQLIKPSDNNW